MPISDICKLDQAALTKYISLESGTICEAMMVKLLHLQFVGIKPYFDWTRTACFVLLCARTVLKLTVLCSLFCA